MEEAPSAPFPQTNKSDQPWQNLSFREYAEQWINKDLNRTIERSILGSKKPARFSRQLDLLNLKRRTTKKGGMFTRIPSSKRRFQQSPNSRNITISKFNSNSQMPYKRFKSTLPGRPQNKSGLAETFGDHL